MDDKIWGYPHDYGNPHIYNRYALKGTIKTTSAFLIFFGWPGMTHREPFNMICGLWFEPWSIWWDGNRWHPILGWACFVIFSHRLGVPTIFFGGHGSSASVALQEQREALPYFRSALALLEPLEVLYVEQIQWLLNWILLDFSFGDLQLAGSNTAHKFSQYFLDSN